MIKTISKVGNSQGVIFDAASMDPAQPHPPPRRERPNCGMRNADCGAQPRSHGLRIGQVEPPSSRRCARPRRNLNR
jgi:hypothetical protein